MAMTRWHEKIVCLGGNMQLFLWTTSTDSRKFPWGSLARYPLVIKDSNGKSRINEGFDGRIVHELKRWCSIAMIDYQRVDWRLGAWMSFFHLSNWSDDRLPCHWTSNGVVEVDGIQRDLSFSKKTLVLSYKSLEFLRWNGRICLLCVKKNRVLLSVPILMVETVTTVVSATRTWVCLKIRYSQNLWLIDVNRIFSY